MNSGNVDVPRLRQVLAGLPVPPATGGRLVLAVDVSDWLRPRRADDLTEMGRWRDGDSNILIVFDAGYDARAWPTALTSSPPVSWDGCARTGQCDRRRLR